MEFLRQEYWSGLPFPSPGDLPDPGWTQVSCLAGGFFTIWAPREAPNAGAPHLLRSLMKCSSGPSYFAFLPFVPGSCRCKKPISYWGPVLLCQEVPGEEVWDPPTGSEWATLRFHLLKADGGLLRSDCRSIGAKVGMGKICIGLQEVLDTGTLAFVPDIELRILNRNLQCTWWFSH